MEWISSLQFEPFRAWFFVFRTDDYRVFASICVLGVASLLLFYLAPNDALLNGKKTYDTKKRIYQSGLVLHFALCVCAILIIRWWVALILVAIGTAVIPAYEKWVANYYHQETVVITPKKRLAYLLLGLAGIVAGLVLHFVIPEGNDFLL